MKLLVLLLVAALHGRATADLFRRFTNPAAVRSAMNRLLAHVLELRLFVDEPGLVFRAQRDMLRANLALLRQFAVPLLCSGAILAVVWVPMNRFLATNELKIGESSFVRAESTEPALDLIAPFGVAVESPALRIPRENATFWRIRALSPITGEFRTTPVARPVQVEYPAARYLGMPWLLLFTLASSARILLALRFRQRVISVPGRVS